MTENHPNGLSPQFTPYISLHINKKLNKTQSNINSMDPFYINAILVGMPHHMYMPPDNIRPLKSNMMHQNGCLPLFSAYNSFHIAGKIIRNPVVF